MDDVLVALMAAPKASLSAGMMADGMVVQKVVAMVFAKVVMLVVAKGFLRVASKDKNWVVRMVWMLAGMLVALLVALMVERMAA